MCKIYPNPALSDQVTVKNCRGIDQISVRDTSGRLIWSRHYETEDQVQIPVIDLMPGMYYVRINNEHLEELIIR